MRFVIAAWGVVLWCVWVLVFYFELLPVGFMVALFELVGRVCFVDWAIACCYVMRCFTSVYII